MFTINPNIPPPNGFKFLNDDGTTITGNSWEQLERNVLVYRRQINGKTDGIWDEILNQVCSNSPGFCKDSSGKQIEEARVRENAKARLLKWLSDLSAKSKSQKPPKVCDNTARIRSKTCMACPKRQTAELGCASCASSANKLREVILDGKRSVSAGLGACQITGEDLGVSIHLLQDPLPPDGLPEFCWRRK